MARYLATVEWDRGEQDFLDGKYSRAHRVAFDGGVEIEGSSSPHVVPPPMSSASGVDPEEMLIAALSSCHMLTFLHLAKKAGFLVDRYRDQAEGMMGQTAQGRFAVTRVALHPEIGFSGERTPSEAELAELHHRAHLDCFIANSVITEVVVEPTPQRETVHA